MTTEKKQKDLLAAAAVFSELQKTFPSGDIFLVRDEAGAFHLHAANMEVFAANIEDLKKIVSGFAMGFMFQQIQHFPARSQPIIAATLKPRFLLFTEAIG